MKYYHFALCLSLTVVANCASSPKPSYVTREMASDYRVRHPIIVSNKGAYVPHQCGQWPKDLGSDFLEGASNRPDWNYACSTQKNLAAMVVNPNDLLGPRTETAVDARRRQTVIDKYRKGEDTSGKSSIDDKNKLTKAGG